MQIKLQIIHMLIHNVNDMCMYYYKIDILGKNWLWMTNFMFYSLKYLQHDCIFHYQTSIMYHCTILLTMSQVIKSTLECLASLFVEQSSQCSSFPIVYIMCVLCFGGIWNIACYRLC